MTRASMEMLSYDIILKPISRQCNFSADEFRRLQQTFQLTIVLYCHSAFILIVKSSILTPMFSSFVRMHL